MLYRTKATMVILTKLTKKEAFQLLDVVKDVQKKFYIGDLIFPFVELKKADAVDSMRWFLANSELDIPAHLRGPLERFMELMIEERAPMDMLVEEYNTALSRVFQPELFKPEATQDGLPDRPEPAPEASTKGEDTLHPDAAGPEDASGDKLEKESERRKASSDYADVIVDCLIDQGMSFDEMFYAIDTARARLNAERALYRGRLDTTPIKELWGMEERGQQEDA